MKQNSENLDKQIAILKVLAHPVRLEILEYLSKGPSCANLTNKTVKISQPNLSQHLNTLKNAGIIDCRVDAQRRCYFICRPSLVKGLLDLLRKKHPYVPCDKAEQK